MSSAPTTRQDRRTSQIQPRNSTETERTLIPDTQSPLPSRSASPARTLVDTNAPAPYRGFPSQAHYLAALHEWAEEKRYIQPSTTLTGFYGGTTLETYASQPKLNFGISRRLRERRERKKRAKEGVA